MLQTSEQGMDEIFAQSRFETYPKSLHCKFMDSLALENDDLWMNAEVSGDMTPIIKMRQTIINSTPGLIISSKSSFIPLSTVRLSL